MLMSEQGNETPPIDLTTCDLEPIHIIGRIQSFGYLLSFSSDWMVNHVSANCAELVGRDAAEIVGVPGNEVLAAEALHDIRSRLQMLGSADSVERMFGIDLTGDGRLFDLAVHVSGRSFIVEAEPAAPGKPRDHSAYVRPMIQRMRQAPSLQKLCDTAARQVRALTGFHRVMIYRFDPDGAGEVIAESLAGGIASYRGLHFPASDIPAQARRLYARNILRIISDVDDPTVPIVPAVNPSGEPLDLSMSGLRAVSPIHIEYLKNMGVSASMSVSIMRRDRLWGLITCHHYAPLQLPYSVRTAAELFGEYFAYLVEQAEIDQAIARRAGTTRLHDQIMARLAGGSSLFPDFEDFAGMIGEMIDFDGVIGFIGGEFTAHGITPDHEEFVALARFLNTTQASAVWASDHLADAFPPAAAYADRCAGALALPVSRTPRDYVVLFRREHVHDVNWAGDPTKPIEVGTLGARLTPRKSFDLWTEERRGRSRPWRDDEIAAADGLRVTLLEVVLRLADEAHRERKQANACQDILIAELNHRVRNILNLIRGLVTQSRAGAVTIDQFADIVGDRIYALARAHDQATRSNWTAASIHDLIRAECKAYIVEGPARLSIVGLDALIQPNAFATMALVIHELTTNSCKYGALCDGTGTVAVTLVRSPSGGLEIDWVESGGPLVTVPERRGFGSTIIERTIPHELEGEAHVEYRPAGLVARFVLPPSSIASFRSLPEDNEDPGHELATSMAVAKPLSDHALIVEDNMIIALEAEDILRALGSSYCHVSGSVADGLRKVAAHDCSFALLDINLGNETSAAIAEALTKRGTPFVFASGYGDGVAVPTGFEHVPVVTKPYSKADVAAAIIALNKPLPN